MLIITAPLTGPYLMKDMRWVDGSVTSDIPRQRVASLFNVTSWIVSQVNPHIVPCMNFYCHTVLYIIIIIIIILITSHYKIMFV